LGGARVAPGQAVEDTVVGPGVSLAWPYPT